MRTPSHYKRINRRKKSKNRERSREDEIENRQQIQSNKYMSPKRNNLDLVYQEVKSYYEKNKMLPQRFSKSALRTDNIKLENRKSNIKKPEINTNLYYRSIFY